MKLKDARPSNAKLKGSKPWVEKPDKKPSDEIGSRRGVETLFRNSYRAHLDLIALTATKANIMISLNGLILSFLFISEAFVIPAEPLLEIPIMIFLVTCFLSLAFAILAAVPSRRKGNWTEADFSAQRANPLVFEDYTALTEDEFVPVMRATLQDSPRIYDSMIRQIYFLGSHANKRLKMLNVSYRAFLIGLGLTVLASLIVLPFAFFQDSNGPEATAAQPAEAPSLPYFDKFRKSTGIFEASGVTQLPDGRLILAEDESAQPFSVASLDAEGGLHLVAPTSQTLLTGSQGLRGLGTLSDMEGVALGKDGAVYAVTSFSRTKKVGRISANRERLLRFRLEGQHVVAASQVTDLKRHMMAQYPDLAASVALRRGGLNIEGLALDPDRRQLWLGFRSPLADDKAIILAIENPAALFDGDAPRFRRWHLDLDGAGIRGLAYVPQLRGYLVLARREDKKKQPFELWFWPGGEADAARRVEVDGLKKLRRAEGITPIELGDSSAILIVSDEGDAGSNKPGRYVLLHYDQLSIQ